MNIVIDASTPVRELAGRYPQCRDVFTEHQIDYCFGGNQALDAAAHKSGSRRGADSRES